MTEHPSPDALVDLALAAVPEPGRSALAQHLDTCEGCRQEYTAVSSAVDHVLAAAPRVEPPPGFDSKVLAAMGMTGATAATDADADAGAGPFRAGARTARGSVPGPATAAHGRLRTGTGTGTGTGPAAGAPRGRRRTGAAARPRRFHLAATLAAGVGLLVGAGATAGVLLGREQHTPPTASVAVGTPVVTAAGATVGSVASSWYDGEDVLVVDVSGGRAGASYECWLVLADGTRQSVGKWVLADDRGATWVVPAPTSAVDTLELTTQTGAVWATARL
ncbi:anti-sigma factor [Georgenia sp. SYP-B2076]|uniref:anti-sigma factor n=1 Tax=Georgenia sp. SYP-B2076 TaxID=2495881 RepID=UPI000F8D9902|nr:anti-sigma factor [Georgenia sp. SYP-B2076]